ncbi:MAG: DNA repair protein RecN [Prevotellaceae bacterium]|jgi:DNA repair protein RecN (Recombination protein N)|nr:DNA repair protein RecN [Prevotellaceae bacterium]
MLQTLSIENYALIEKLHIAFPNGLSIITGETGAGKSILLGALSLILGQRADTASLKDATKNCVVEGSFVLDGYGLEELFAAHDIEYDTPTTVRRVISPNGKSRAFVNEIPVTINALKELGDRLIDIHSQHQNLFIGASSFQTTVVDAQANHAATLADYRHAFNAYKAAAHKLAEWKEKAQRAKQEFDYLQFQHNELTAVQLKQGEQQELEEELKQLTHAEEIKTALTKVNALLSNEDTSVDNLLRDAATNLQRISHALQPAQALAERINSARIELRDVNAEIETLNGKTELSPDRLTVVENRLNTLYSLQQKHHLLSVEELLALHAELREKLNAIENFDDTLATLQHDYDEQCRLTQSLATAISEKRRQITPSIETHITQMLQQLGMPHAVFRIAIEEAEQYHASGKDNIRFLFSANKDVAPQELSRIASGGEISRVMLCLKSLMVRSSGLPTIIFDEIDTGVSGEIADRMGNIVYELSRNMQVINITHLPQVASKGNAHYVVYKEENAAGATVTCIKPLGAEERVMEIAKMLSGQNVTQAAIDNAKELLKS